VDTSQQSKQSLSPHAYVKPHIQKDDGFIRLVAACAEQYQEDKTTGVYSLVQLPFDYDGTCSQGANFEQVPSYAPYPVTFTQASAFPGRINSMPTCRKTLASSKPLKLQVRLEAFNVFNHPLWEENPTAAPTTQLSARSKEDRGAK